jgi:hypothetical protein
MLLTLRYEVSTIFQKHSRQNGPRAEAMMNSGFSGHSSWAVVFPSVNPGVSIDHCYGGIALAGFCFLWNVQTTKDARCVINRGNWFRHWKDARPGPTSGNSEAHTGRLKAREVPTVAFRSIGKGAGTGQLYDDRSKASTRLLRSGASSVQKKYSGGVNL